MLNSVVQLVDARPNKHILDLGTGTGSLARFFLDLGCRVTATDFSPAMLTKARQRVPEAELILADLREPLPTEILRQKFDRIVSAYVFHHFELPAKVAILKELARQLTPGGWLVIADLSFPDQSARDALRQSLGDAWDEEFYWIASEALPALEEAGFKVKYSQVSNCAGIYEIHTSKRIAAKANQ